MLVKSEKFNIDEVYSLGGVDYSISGQIEISLFDDSDYSTYGPYFYTEVEHSLKINPFNQAALDSFIEDRENNFD